MRICRLEERLLLVTGSEVGTRTQSRVFEEAVYEGILKLVRINDNKLGQTLQTQLRQREELQQLIQDMYTNFEESVCDASYFVRDDQEAAEEFQQPIREFVARVTQLEDRSESVMFFAHLAIQCGVFAGGLLSRVFTSMDPHQNMIVAMLLPAP
eukprot:s6600_g3.t1